MSLDHRAPSPFMTREEAAEYLRVAPRTVDRMAREGKLTRFRLTHGDRPRFRRSEVASLIEIDDLVGRRSPAQLIKANEVRQTNRNTEQTA